MIYRVLSFDFTLHNEHIADARNNQIYLLLQKTFKGLMILRAYECDKKDKKLKKFQEYTSKLAKLVIENEFMNENFE